MSTPRLLLNLISFQAGWFACVLGAAQGWPWTGAAVAILLTALHAWRAPHPKPEVALAALVVLAGACWDSALALSGWLVFSSVPAASPWRYLAPPWIWAMWAVFATTLNVSLRWLRARRMLASALGGAAGPAAYWAGARLGAVHLVEAGRALSALALGWALMLPAFLALARRFDGMQAK